MNREIFIKKLKDALYIVEEIDNDTVLNDLDEWDSLSKIELMAFIDKEFNQQITIEEINKFVTIGDIMEKIKI